MQADASTNLCPICANLDTERCPRRMTKYSLLGLTECTYFWPATRNTTQGELLQMHAAAEATMPTKPPSHYEIFPGKDLHSVEDAVWGSDMHSAHLEMAAVEYIIRARKKGTYDKDLEKAMHCLSKALALRAKGVK